ncbi:MAG: hypothetical protein RL368_399 [Pseudomonadota bacterium]
MCGAFAADAFQLGEKHAVGDSFMQIRLRGALQINHPVVNGIEVASLSGLAWDEDEQILYAISDTGELFHLRPIIQEQVLKDVEVLKAYVLTDAEGKKLPKASTDSEGLSLLNGNNGVKGDSELIISFERKPKITRVRPDGVQLDEYTLPEMLQNAKLYVNNNKMLESVTLHPEFGILTTPEYPLKNLPQDKITVFSLDGQQWQFPRHTAPNSAVVAMEALADGSLLVMERAYVSLLLPLIISLRQVELKHCVDCEDGENPVQDLAIFNSALGWHVDNFEGLTHHQGQFFFMVSDDNNNRITQKTLLNYFEIIAPPHP